MIIYSNRETELVPKFKGLSIPLSSGCTKTTFSSVLQGIYLLLKRFSADLDLSLADSDGNTALLALGPLLEDSAAATPDSALATETYLIARTILNRVPPARAGLNATNTAHRTLLSYAAAAGDAAIPLARLLLNAGALVCPALVTRAPLEGGDLVRMLAIERESSAFTWMLRAQTASGRAAHVHSQTLSLISEAFPLRTRPLEVKAHVQRVMMHCGHAYGAHSDIYRAVVAKMCPIWAQPPGLSALCRKSVRGALGARNLSEEPEKLARNLADVVPRSIVDFLQLN